MTPATVQLDKAGVAYETVDYDHDPSIDDYGQEAVDALGVDGSLVFKTVVAELGVAEIVVAVLPVVCLLDLKALARAARAKKAALASTTVAERRTGYVVGGISPFGQRQRHRTFVDESALLYERIHVSAGRRGLEVVVAPAAFETVLDATFADLTG